MNHNRRRFLALSAAAALAGVAGAALALRPITSAQPSHDDIAGKPDLVVADASRDLKRTTVAGALAEPHAAGRSILWCSTLQLAWNELGGVMGAPLTVGGDPPLARRLNAAKESRADLDEASCVALAGFGRDGILDAIKAQLQAKFAGAASPKLLPASVPPDDILAYAYLFKNLAFATPFIRAEYPLDFGAGAGAVKSFGLWDDHRVEDWGALARQVVVHSYTSPMDWTVELLTGSEGDRLVVARLSPGATLAHTVDATLATLGSADEPAFRPGDRLAVPLMNFDITRSYEELVGRHIAGSKHSGEVAYAIQNIRFRLDETGAVLKSEAAIGVTTAFIPDGPRIMVCDGPFLVLMLRKDADRPYFAAWVENPELLVAAD